MKKSTSLAVIGGDLRQACLAQLLCADGHQVTVSALDRHTFTGNIQRSATPGFGIAEGVQAVILPMPAERDGVFLNAPLSNTSHHISAVLDALPSDMLVLAGAASDALRSRAAKNHLHLIDYLAREELAIRNAVPTAEGAIQLAMEEMPITLHGCHALVIGNGRVGSILAAKLYALGAKVWVSARSPRDFARIETAGHIPLHTRALTGHLSGLDLVINTVPARVLGVAQLTELPETCLVLDLASKPGGADDKIRLVLQKQRFCSMGFQRGNAPLAPAAQARGAGRRPAWEKIFPKRRTFCLPDSCCLQKGGNHSASKLTLRRIPDPGHGRLR